MATSAAVSGNYFMMIYSISYGSLLDGEGGEAVRIPNDVPLAMPFNRTTLVFSSEFTLGN